MTNDGVPHTNFENILNLTRLFSKYDQMTEYKNDFYLDILYYSILF